MNNFITGEWNSLWKVSKEKIEGSVSVKGHIFESGNVQMNQVIKIEQEFQFTANMDENASNIIKIIEKFEHQAQSGLSQVYE